MDLSIRAIRDAGSKELERIVLRVREDCNVGDFLIMDTTYNGTHISNKLRHTYWFPDKDVRKGDLVVLYTKEGKISEKVNLSGNTSHFFYWNLKETVWNKDEDCAVLFSISEYETKER
ncbi:MAG: hypothetical protein IJM92_09460 [Fibrobacter sp.]|uniref:hypothetical protein n=1 Tax=Fibrobacter sp. TaxID=35828 RepID=UPI0025C3C4BC|nr:hypothetical protein [Fibrobacter sp.]MBQ3715292.1 hypothetical protein [Fibrobacter sp.]MBQ7079867.1 hypothetical protein [Fibrobacter sp.]